MMCNQRNFSLFLYCVVGYGWCVIYSCTCGYFYCAFCLITPPMIPQLFTTMLWFDWIDMRPRKPFSGISLFAHIHPIIDIFICLLFHCKCGSLILVPCVTPQRSIISWLHLTNALCLLLWRLHEIMKIQEFGRLWSVIIWCLCNEITNCTIKPLTMGASQLGVEIFPWETKL